MKLTRRGQVALAVVGLAVVLGWQFGARSLNAIAAPILAGLLCSAVLLSRSESPAVEVSTPTPGFPEETRTLSISVSGSGLATVSLSLPEGIDGETTVRRVTLPETVTFDVELTDRGIHTVGPPEIAYRGPLGLLERTVPVRGVSDVVVYPQPYTVTSGSILSQFFLDELEAERQEFDRLREYRPGDPLRNVHWKSSAKYDDFLVMEFAPSRRDETVTVVATAPKGEVDEMARLAATVTDTALDAGYNVELATPAGHIGPGHGDAHRTSLLRLLARTTAGTLTPVSADEADVEIGFRNRSLGVRIGTDEYTVEELLDRVRIPEPTTDHGTEEAAIEGNEGVTDHGTGAAAEDGMVNQ